MINSFLFVQKIGSKLRLKPSSIKSGGRGFKDYFSGVRFPQKVKNHWVRQLSRTQVRRQTIRILHIMLLVCGRYSPRLEFHNVIRHSSCAHTQQWYWKRRLVPEEFFHIDVRVIDRIFARGHVQYCHITVTDRIVFADRQSKQRGLTIGRLEI